MICGTVRVGFGMPAHRGVLFDPANSSGCAVLWTFPQAKGVTRRRRIAPGCIGRAFATNGHHTRDPETTKEGASKAAPLQLFCLRQVSATAIKQVLEPPLQAAGNPN